MLNFVLRWLSPLEFSINMKIVKFQIGFYVKLCHSIVAILNFQSKQKMKTT